MHNRDDDLFNLGEDIDESMELLEELISGLIKAREKRSIRRALSVLFVKANEGHIMPALAIFLKRILYNMLNDPKKSKFLRNQYKGTKSYKDYINDNLLDENHNNDEKNIIIAGIPSILRISIDNLILDTEKEDVRNIFNIDCFIGNTF